MYIYTLTPLFNRLPFNEFWKQETKADAIHSVCFSVKVPCMADGGLVSLDLGRCFHVFPLLVYFGIVCLIKCIVLHAIVK